jgi:subtilisin family serine protease
MNGRTTQYGGELVRIRPKRSGFVSRADKESLSKFRTDNEQIGSIEELSPHSFRVNTSPSLSTDELLEVIVQAREFGPAFFDYEQVPDDDSDSSHEDFLITDRLFVTLRQSPNAGKIETFCDRHHVRLVPDDNEISDRTYLVQTSQGDDPVIVLDNMLHDPMVEDVEHDLNHQVIPLQVDTPTAQYFPDQWHLLHATNNATLAPSVACDKAWERLGGFGSEDVVVGIIDGAFAVEHGDITSAIKRYAFFNGHQLVTSADMDPTKTTVLKSGAKTFQITHGTACAALIAARTSGFSVGVAPGCSLFLAKVPISSGKLVVSDSQLTAIVRAMRDEVDVITSSWGSSHPKERWSRHTRRVLENAATKGGRRRKGIVFIWSAGNSDRPLHALVDKLVPYEKIEPDGVSGVLGVRMRSARKFVNQLVGLENVLHVAASTSGAKRARYSNYGNGIMLCAPGHNDSLPFGCPSADVVGDMIYTSGFNPGLPAVEASFGGTSAAASIVAGVAALTISANQSLSAAEVVTILKETAERDKLDFSGYAPMTCVAVADVSPVPPFEDGTFRDVNGLPWSPWFGFGRVDAERAVIAALNKASK